MQHVRLQEALFEGKQRGQQDVAQHEQLVKQGLARDREPLTPHAADLALERECVEVLVDSDLYDKGEVIASAKDELCGPQSGLDMFAVTAVVFLALIVLDEEGALDGDDEL